MMDIRPGDPNEGEWHDAHYPTPRRLGGQETVALLSEHHAVQGVLQSEEFGCLCFHSWERKHLPKELLPLWHKWRSWWGRQLGEQQRFKAANAYWAANPEKKKAQIKESLEKAQKACEKHLFVEDTRDSHLMLFESVKQAAQVLDLCPIDLAKVARGVRQTINNKRYKAYYA